MKLDARELPRRSDAAPVPAQIVRRKQLPVDGGEDQGGGLDGTEPKHEPKL